MTWKCTMLLKSWMMDIRCLPFRLIVLCFISLSPDCLNAQTGNPIKVSGLIVDSIGNVVPGVSVNVKDTQIGVVSDDMGEFLIRVPSEKSVLEFWYLGTNKQEIVVGKKRTIRVVLRAVSIEMDEVLVVGYGTVRKSDLTGAVSKLTPENTSDNPVTSVEQLLQGRVSGVQVTQSSGGPAAGIDFLIRGANSTSSNRPLIVIDGYPIDPGSGGDALGGDGIAISGQATTNPLSNIDPSEIESIEILKDASSTAIYGSRGANGVVIITTKRGKIGQDKIEFSYRSDISNARSYIDVLSTNEYIDYVLEGFANSDIPLPASWTPERIEMFRETDNFWQDEVYHTASSNKYQMSISGGEGRTKYAIIGNVASIGGVIKNSAYNRGGVRLNLDREFSNKLKVSLNLSASKSKTNLSVNSSSNGGISGNVVTSALLFGPHRIPYNAEGDIDQTVEANPLTMVNLIKDQYENNLMYGNLMADYRVMKGLIFRVNLGGNLSNGLRQAYHPRGTLIGTQRGGYAYRSQNNNFNYLSEFTLNYNKNFNGNRLDATAGYTWQQWNVNRIGTSTSDFPNDKLDFYSFQSGNAPGASTTVYQESALASFLARINYTIQNKYLFTVTGRSDGSTRLAEGHKWAFFPSIGIGWNVHRENFMKNSDVFSNLKIRASYGVSGNQSVSIGATAATLNSGLRTTTVVNGAIVKGYILNNIANPQLSWETTSQVNLGLDIGILKNRLSLEVNAYRKKTEDLLIPLPIPAATGFSTYISNSGSVENRGLEFDLRANVLTRAFKWRISGNVSFNRNKVLDLGAIGDDETIFGPNYLNYASLLSQPIHISQIGSSIGAFYGYQIRGIYQNEEEVAQGPESSSAKPGDFKFVDVDDDGRITGNDRGIIGNPYPAYIFGLTNNFSWKDVSFSFLIQGSIGNEVANLNRFRLDALNATNQYNVSREAYENRWTGEGTSDTYPRAIALGGYFNSRFSDFIIEDASYVRLKNVNISYRIPVSTISWVSGIRVFATATNLVTITNYSGYDPEVSANPNNALTPGVDNGTYPQTRTVSFGINLTF